MALRLFADRETGLLIRIEKMDQSYVQITVLTALTSHYSMPRAIYETDFVKRYRPATTEDLRKQESGEIEYPRNAPPDWFDDKPVDGSPIEELG
jgi:hypothetical protein